MDVVSYSKEIEKDALDDLDERVGSVPESTKGKRGSVDWFSLKFLPPPETIESWAKIIFPTTYLIFNVVYWMYYLVIIDM